MPGLRRDRARGPAFVRRGLLRLRLHRRGSFRRLPGLPWRGGGGMTTAEQIAAIVRDLPADLIRTLYTDALGRRCVGLAGLTEDDLIAILNYLRKE